MEEKAYTGPMRFAHRGLAQAAPENTVGAFQAAVDAGFEGMEIDVQLSGDGEIIVAHDDNFTRMTLGHPTGFTNARLRELTWEEIRAIELPYANHTLPDELPCHSEVEEMALVPDLVMGQAGGRDYRAALAREPRMAHLMRFLDFDAWLARQSAAVTVEVEVKAAGMMPRMLELLSRSRNAGRYILFSGDPALIREIQSACREDGKPDGLRLGANLRYLTQEAKAAVQAMDLFEVGLNAGRFSAEDVRWLSDRGIRVLSNLGDFPQWWRELCALDVLGFKTNYASAFTRWWMRER